MKIKLTGLVVILSMLFPIQAQAVENGEDATGSSFVVPISIDRGDGRFGSCSGALIAPSIVVTAGHCVLDANGLMTKNLYVGIAGSSFSSITTEDKISGVQITSTFQNTSAGNVGDDDLAFLTLAKPQAVRVPIILASEKQITDFKSRSVALKSFGYGQYSNAGSASVSFPKSFSGSFSSQSSAYPNSADMVSTSGTSCAGDSGSPILNISATQVTLVGILTGSIRGASDFCGQKSSDGKYYTLFTLVGRYANLAFSAATDVMNTQDLTIKSQAIKLSDFEVELGTATADAAEAKSLLVDANATIAELKKKIPQTITCTKGKLTKKITAVNPICPAGYKKK